MAEGRALVTGAVGFIGSHLVVHLRRKGWTVVALSRRSISVRDDPGITVLKADLNEPKQLADAVAQAGEVAAFFHLAAHVPRQSRTIGCAPFVRTNVLATSVLLDLFEASSADAFVNASSISVIGVPVHLPIREDHATAPTHPYAASKLAAELIGEEVRRRTGRRLVSLRIASPYGPGMAESTVLPRFARAVLSGQDIELYGRGDRTQTFVHVRDVVSALMSAAQQGAGVYNVGGPFDVSMRDLARLAIELVPDTKTRIVHLDRRDPQETYRWCLDTSKAARELGYEPRVSLQEGLAGLIQCFRTGEPPSSWWKQQ
ncbi:MAG: NAD-dependent epimerase/dehydratase family protein [Phycisphaerae bacterium]|nr:NAD-dependent epimerase/dehydratase family protein [Phycisphaerae bacterium]